MPTKPDSLIVASTTNWIHDDFKLADENFPIHKSTGLGIPNLRGSERPAIWCSTAHAARLKHAGLDLPLVSPGPEWLAAAPEHLLGRTIYHWELGTLRNSIYMDDERLMWIKLAEMKDDRLPAQRTTIRDFIMAAETLGAPPETNIQFSSTNLCIVEENRFFILDHKVVTGSTYMKLNDIWDYDKHINDNGWKVNTVARDYAQYVANYMKHWSPRAYTMDIGQVMPPDCVSPDYHVVIEVNPVWSSAYYGAELKQVLRCLLASVDYSEQDLEHRWEPDPWLKKRAEYKAALKPE